MKHDITETLNAMTPRERDTFHRSLESSDHYDRFANPTVEFYPLNQAQRVAINARLEEVEPGLRIGTPMSTQGATRLISAYFTPAEIAEMMAR